MLVSLPVILIVQMTFAYVCILCTDVDKDSVWWIHVEASRWMGVLYVQVSMYTFTQEKVINIQPGFFRLVFNKNPS